VKGELPPQRETVCTWDPNVIRAYEPLMPSDVSTFNDPLEIFSAIDTEIQLSPEYYYSSFTEDTSFACTYGGSFTFGPSNDGESYSFKNCQFTKGFSITGTGSYDYSNSVFKLETQVSGVKKGTLTYTRDDNDGSASVSGEYGGEQIDLKK
ncbi:MAG TPA: hypothetical protein VMT73_06740, partial [Anaerolineales bacterium]|nr:hypothetical protein [Anaerolineales bacterium]